MARRTARKVTSAAKVIVARQLFPDFFLIFRGFPIHIENLILRSQIPLRISVALETPLHIQRRSLEHQRHLVYRPVAGRAAHTLIHVNAVVEVNIIRQTVYLYPVNRLFAAITLANWLQISHIVEQHRMAIHAGLGRRNPRIRRGFHTGMAKTAVNTVISHVMFVAELNWLASGHALVGYIG